MIGRAAPAARREARDTTWGSAGHFALWPSPDPCCVAGTTVEAIGEDRLAELGVTPEDVGGMGGADFTDDEIDTLVDAFFDCVDIRQVLAANLAGDAGEEAAGCMAENLPEDALRDFVRAFNFEGKKLPAGSEQALREVAAECGVPVD